MPNPPLKVFLASSSELQADRKAFEILINRKNKAWHARGVFLELVLWEDFLDAVSPTRKQADYNQAIRGCDLFVLLVATQVGPWSEEEFDTAIGQFQATARLTQQQQAALGIEGLQRRDGGPALTHASQPLQQLARVIA